jgi:hypothetical protein
MPSFRWVGTTHENSKLYLVCRKYGKITCTAIIAIGNLLFVAAQRFVRAQQGMYGKITKDSAPPSIVLVAGSTFADTRQFSKSLFL